mmetsp:Transcript_20962/g.52951  ORF Transcript_20962/g.52951 Transcript_20962/m.52951 type:complete len:236 (+) Transcript_20962:258-965(+)
MEESRRRIDDGKNEPGPVVQCHEYMLSVVADLLASKRFAGVFSICVFLAGVLVSSKQECASEWKFILWLFVFGGYLTVLLLLQDDDNKVTAGAGPGTGGSGNKQGTSGGDEGDERKIDVIMEWTRHIFHYKLHPVHVLILVCWSACGLVLFAGSPCANTVPAYAVLTPSGVLVSVFLARVLVGVGQVSWGKIREAVEQRMRRELGVEEEEEHEHWAAQRRAETGGNAEEQVIEGW